MSKIAALSLVAALAACSPAIGAPDNARRFDVASFDAVTLRGSDTVRVVRGNRFAVEARGPSGLLDQLDIRRDGTTLVVSRKPSIGWTRGTAVVTITMPALRAAAIDGSGDLNVDLVTGERFDARVAGSGDMIVERIAGVRNVGLAVAGSGTLTTGAGKAGALAASLNGSGDIDADRLEAQTAAVAVTGSGNTRARATGSATLKLNGSGTALVKGTRNCTIDRSGSGTAQCAG